MNQNKQIDVTKSKNNDNGLDVHRRSFVKQASLGAAAVSLSPLAAPFVQAQNGNNKVLKVGVVGLGGRGGGALNNILAADPNTKIWAVADIFERRTKKYEGNTKGGRIDTDGNKRIFLGFDGYQKVIDSGVDIVILTTPPAFRPLHLAAAVAAGKHVFMEKPFAIDIPGLKSVVDSARKAQSAGLSVMTGLVWRYSKHLMELHKRIQGGEIGDVVSVSSSYCGGGRPNKMPDIKFKPATMSNMEWSLRYWQNYLELGGDGILEFMIHGLDKMCWAMGDQMPVRCYGIGGNMKPVVGANSWDQFSLNFEYADGRRADFLGRQIPGTYTASGDSILGTNGIAEANKGGVSIKRDGKVIWQSKGGLGYQHEHEILLQHIRSGKVYNDVIGKMEHSHALAIMGRTAGYTGQLISSKQLMTSTDQLIDCEGLNFETAFEARPAAEIGKTKFS
ncbi:MAG: Gfo/Idh/MocA family oxidoreductase [Akkermansiaceae bacterium]|nr:Gfo/Idh/MocA family oxidoreductase [Akkermansiaceae bacterium]